MDGDEFAGTVEEDVGIEAAVGHLEAPDGLAGAGVDAGDVAAAGADVENAMAAEIAEDRRAHGIIDRFSPRGTGPDEFARAFLKRVVAAARGTVGAPVGGDALGEEELAVGDE